MRIRKEVKKVFKVLHFLSRFIIVYWALVSLIFSSIGRVLVSRLSVWSRRGDWLCATKRTLPFLCERYYRRFRSKVSMQ